MPRPRKPQPWVYDPRPVDALTIRCSYDWPSGRYRLTISVKRHGQVTADTESLEGLDRDDVADHVAVVLSSMAEDGAEPF